MTDRASVAKATPFIVKQAIDAKAKLQKQPPLPHVELDTEENIALAKHWLINRAPRAIAWQSGNETTYKVACRVKDFGISPEECVELLRKHWNETKADPQWDYDDLVLFAKNAHHYGKKATGVDAHTPVELDFGPVDPPGSIELLATPYSGRELATVPPRRWIVPGLLARSFVTGLISPPGMGKTQLIANFCIAIPRDDEKPIGRRISEKTAVWYWNQEDDKDELERRIGAARKQFGVGEVPGLFVDSGVSRSLLLVERKGGRLVATAQVAAIISEIRRRNVGVFIVDPLQETHEASENDNPEMRVVWSTLRRIAVEGNCAVWVAAHSRKPPQAPGDSFVGDADSLRGASSQVGVLRIAHTLHNMSAKDAKAHGIQEADRRYYVRLDDAKSNLHLGGEPRWFKRISVAGSDIDETIGVLEPALLERKPSVDLLHVLAKTIAAAGAVHRGPKYPLAEVIEAMPVADRAPFNSEKHRSRAVDKALADHGLSTEIGIRQSSMTEFGVLEIIKRKGRGGTTVSLAEETPQFPTGGKLRGDFGYDDEMFH